MTFAPGAVIIYENDSVPLLAVILSDSGGRFRVLNEQGAELSLPTARLTPTALQCSADKSALPELQRLREQIETAQSSISLQDLWEALKESPRTYGSSELMELYLGTPLPLHAVAMHMVLLKDRTFFKRETEGFSPRTEQAVEQCRKLEQQHKERQALSQAFVAFVEQRLADRTIALPSTLQPLMRSIEDIAAENPDISAERHEFASETLKAAHALLKSDQRLPLEQLANKLLDAIGHFDRNTNISLYRYRPPIEFKAEAQAEAAAAAAQEPRLDTLPREDLTALECVTIDDVTTLDMDDAISLQETERGYELGVHITDVSAIVAIGSALDNEARRRATSLYLPERTIPMLPRELSESRCSLVEAAMRPALSCFMLLDRDFRVTSSRVSASIIKVRRRYSYEDVDALLHSQERQMELLFHVASQSEAQRIAGGASKVTKHEAIPVLLEDGTVTLQQVDEDAPSHFLVSEMMVLANKYFAEFAYKNKIPILYRTQEAPEPDGEEDDDAGDGPAADYAFRGKMKRSVMTTSALPHWMLGLRHYTQVTSPIRRFADLCNQRQIMAHLFGQPYPYSSEKLGQIADALETPNIRAVHLSRDSKRFWLLRYLEQQLEKGPVQFKATVVRTDLKIPIVMLDTIFMTCPLKVSPRPALGAEFQVKVEVVQSRTGMLRIAPA